MGPSDNRCMLSVGFEGVESIDWLNGRWYKKMFSQATGESSSWAEPGAAGLPPFYFTWLLKVDFWRKSCGCFCLAPFYSPFKGGAGEAGKADQDLGEWEAPAGVAVAGEGGSDQGERFISLKKYIILYLLRNNPICNQGARERKPCPCSCSWQSQGATITSKQKLFVDKDQKIYMKSMEE